MLDKDFKPWIIEINTNPCLEESSQVLRILLPRMIDDAFKLTVDKVFPNPKYSFIFNQYIHFFLTMKVVPPFF